MFDKFDKLLEPKTNVAALILRLGLAAIFIVHGFIKIYVNFQMMYPLDMTTQRVVGWAELICGLLLFLGLFSRPAAIGIAIMQFMAIYLVTGRHALQILVGNGTAEDYRKVGPEYNLFIIAVCLGVVVLGSGSLSLDRLLYSRWLRRKGLAAPQAAPFAAQPAPQATPVATAAPAPSGDGVVAADLPLQLTGRRPE